MKLISFAVPCYNSQAYMRKCIDSLLVGGDDVEIIIVNDGSADGTLEIAEEYRQKYPSTVKVIDKENGGHGSGVNAGLKAAEGLYYKVVDSDDWLDCEGLKKLIETIKTHVSEGCESDLYITNFIYDHALDNTFFVSAYRDKMHCGRLGEWDKVKPFRFSRILMMHSLLYKREKLIESGTILPEHTFYVDELYAYKPLPFMRKICYLDIDLYHYFIGRDDQSVNKKNFTKRYEQQIRVMCCMTDAYEYDQLKKLPKGLKKYMFHALSVIMLVTTYFTCAETSPERKTALREMWRHIKSTDKKLYAKLRHRSYVTVANCMPWRLRGWVMTKGYNLLCRKVKLG